MEVQIRQALEDSPLDIITKVINLHQKREAQLVFGLLVPAAIQITEHMFYWKQKKRKQAFTVQKRKIITIQYAALKINLKHCKKNGINMFDLQKQLKNMSGR